MCEKFTFVLSLSKDEVSKNEVCRHTVCQGTCSTVASSFDKLRTNVVSYVSYWSLSCRWTEFTSAL
jgi:hypothetical protein